MCDLLRAPPLTQQLHDRVTQLSVTSDPPAPRTTRASPGGLLSVMGSIATAAIAVAPDLPVDGERPTSAAIAPTVAPLWSRSAITTRSRSDKYGGLRSLGGVIFAGG